MLVKALARVPVEQALAQEEEQFRLAYYFGICCFRSIMSSE